MELLRYSFLKKLPQTFIYLIGKKPTPGLINPFRFILIAALLVCILPGLSPAQDFADGAGTDEDPYEITTWEHLNNIRDYLDAHFILMNDLDENSAGYDTYVSPTANGGEGWDPIGNYEDEVAFTGIFDGNGHSISDLFIERFSDFEAEDLNGEDVGLFGYIYSEDLFDGDLSDVENGIVKNLTLEDVDLFGGAFVGAITGTNEGILNNVAASGTVRGFLGVGGLTGENYGLIVGSSSSADVIFPLEEILEDFDEEEIFIEEAGGFGGIAGFNQGFIGLSHATGVVGLTDEAVESAIDTGEDGAGVEFGFIFGSGGLIGFNAGAAVVSYATGDVGGLFATGGLIGVNGFGGLGIPLKNKSSQRERANEVPLSAALDLGDLDPYFDDIEPFDVHNTYATGDVKGFFNAGGLIGFNDGDGLISNSYSAGAVIFWPTEFEEFPDGEIPEDIPFDELGFGGLIGLDEGIFGGLSKSVGHFDLSSLNRFTKTMNIEPSAVEAEENVVNSFWDLQTSGVDTSAGGTGKSTTEMKLTDTFTNTSTEGLSESWDFDDLWAIRSGDYISYPYFGNDNKASEQDPEPGLMQVGGIRLMAGAGQETTVGAALFIVDGDDRITIVSVPDEGILLLNDTEVENDDEILKSDIDSGNLKYVPEDESDKTMYGYDYSTLVYEASENERTLNIDLAARAINYGLPEGWILFSSPSEDQEVGEMLDNIRTDGYNGSDNPGASFPTVYTLDQEDYEWDAINNSSQELVQGEGLLVYIFDEDTPKDEMLSSNGPWAPLDGGFTYDDLLGYDPDQGSGGNSFFLLGNPHPIGIDLCQMLINGSDIATSFYVWFPDENDGNGGYVTYSCDIPPKANPQITMVGVQQEIVPFAGFWVNTLGENASLAITENDYISYDSASKENKSISEPLTFHLNHEERNFDETVHILFSDRAEEGLDRMDAVKLSSAGLAEKYLSFFATDDENRSFALRSLPAHTEEMVIPMDIETTEAGQYRLNWTLPAESAGKSYILRDTKTGTEVKLSSSSGYRFAIAEDNVEGGSEQKAKTVARGAHQKETGNTPRFELVLRSGNGSNQDELPNDITLHQNYPNPFNPTTVIKYQIPQAAEVSLTVFDMAGRQVTELVNDQVSAGSHTINFNASRLSSGVYMYRLKAGSTMLTRKLTVIK